MDRITITVSQAPDGTFWCHSESNVYGGRLNSAGKTVSEAKDDLMICMEDARAAFIEEGGADYEVEFLYKYDLQSFFEYFSFLNVSDIAKRSGINPSLMRQYARGIKTAGEKTYQRLSVCIDKITKDLQAASFR
jgi:hypothetical protein